MKLFSPFFLLCLFFVFASCSNDDDAPDSLPPATQTGEGIFACLVNGEVFVHNDGLINCFYQYVDGGYYFGIKGNKENSTGLFSIHLSTIQKEIIQGATYQLLEESEGNAFGGGALA